MVRRRMRVAMHRGSVAMGMADILVMPVVGTVLLLRHRSRQPLLLHLPGHGFARPAAQGEQQDQKDEQPASHGRMISASVPAGTAAGQILRGCPRFSDRGPSLGYLQ